jgi:hypothetical protein
MTLNLSTYQPTLNPSTFHTETRVVSGSGRISSPTVNVGYEETVG